MEIFQLAATPASSSSSSSSSSLSAPSPPRVNPASLEAEAAAAGIVGVSSSAAGAGAGAGAGELISPSSESESLPSLLPKAKNESGSAFGLAGAALPVFFTGAGFSAFFDSACAFFFGALVFACFGFLMNYMTNRVRKISHSMDIHTFQPGPMKFRVSLPLTRDVKVVAALPCPTGRFQDQFRLPRL